MTIAWAPVLCPWPGDQRSGLPWARGWLGALGVEVVAHEDGEVVSRLSLASSLRALFLCVRLGLGGRQWGGPLLYSHMKPGRPEASSGARGSMRLPQACSSISHTPMSRALLGVGG